MSCPQRLALRRWWPACPPYPSSPSAIAEPSIVDRSRAAWPRPNVHLASADAVMPIPDAAAFDLDESIERDTADAPDTAGDAEWPALAAIAPPSSDAELPAPGLTDIGVNLKGEKLVGTELGLRPTLCCRAAAQAEPRGRSGALRITSCIVRTCPCIGRCTCAPPPTASAPSFAVTPLRRARKPTGRTSCRGPARPRALRPFCFAVCAGRSASGVTNEKEQASHCVPLAPSSAFAELSPAWCSISSGSR